MDRGTRTFFAGRHWPTDRMLGALALRAAGPYNGPMNALGEMVPTTETWTLRRRVPRRWLQDAVASGLDAVLAQVLYARKTDTLAAMDGFLKVEGALGDPYALAGMPTAVERLRYALQKRERMVVYGDFDADGVCATALLVSALRALGGLVEPYIPDRFDEGYGLNEGALERIVQQGARLVVTVDCSVRSLQEAQVANKLGLDLIITDHHSLFYPIEGQPPVLPLALAVINPHQPGCAYPFRDLSGVGLAYRLVEALYGACGMQDTAELSTYLDLVALGTVADVVPLCGENRLLVQWGLGRAAAAPRLGIRALLDVAAVPVERLSSTDIAFRLAPRINAAGRLGSARLAFDLLMTALPDEALFLAAQLQELNRERQKLLEAQFERSCQLLAGRDGRPLLFVAGEEFHEGIVGLVASRLTDAFYRPALVMRRGAEVTRGSARSIDGFHITRALDHCAELLSRYGGHARAAGFTLPTANVEALRERLEAYCNQPEHLAPAVLARRRLVDAIVSLGALSRDTPAALERMEPCGEGNPPPLLATLGLRLLTLRSVGEQGKHLRLDLGDGRTVLPAIAFRQGHLAGQYKAGDRVDALYHPTLNEWQGQTSLQLVVEALRPHHNTTE